MNNHSRVSRRGSVGQLSPTRSPYLIDLHADCERILAEHFVRELQRKRAEKREFRKKRRADHRFIYRVCTCFLFSYRYYSLYPIENPFPLVLYSTCVSLVFLLLVLFFALV